MPILSSCHETGASVPTPDLYSGFSALLVTLLTSRASKFIGSRRLPVLGAELPHGRLDAGLSPLLYLGLRAPLWQRLWPLLCLLPQRRVGDGCKALVHLKRPSDWQDRELMGQKGEKGRTHGGFGQLTALVLLNYFGLTFCLVVF